jgi:primosomal protein N' (replication factor Y)
MTTLMHEETAVQAARYVQVALDIPLDRSFTYAVPEPLLGRLRQGQRVEVPFGRGNRPMVGYVVGLLEETGLEEDKPVRREVDDEPLSEGDLLELARWMAH